MDVTEDALLGGRLRFFQFREGYRAGMDAALLGAACDAGPGQRVLDVGCGAGGVMLAAAVRRKEALFVGLERDPASVELARRNIALNALADRVDAEIFDIAWGFPKLGMPVFDAVLCNPPFFDDPAALRGPSHEKKGAWLADQGLAGWIAFLLKAVRAAGNLTVVHRADRLADLLSGLGEKAGSFQILPVHPFEDAPAKRVIVRAIKGGRAPLRLLPPLVLHAHGGAKHLPAAEAIMRGEAALDWA